MKGWRKTEGGGGVVEDEEGVVSVAGGCCRVVPRGQPGFSFQDSRAGSCGRVEEFPAPSENEMRCVMSNVEMPVTKKEMKTKKGDLLA